MSEYLTQLQGLLFSEDESNLELALELVKTLEIDAWPLYSDLQKCAEFLSEKFKISPNVKALLRYLHQHKGQLNFSNRQLQHLPSYLSALGELVTRLDLGYNQFSQLPDCIAHFSQLKSLNFNNNLISELPKWLFNLRQLEILNCRNSLLYEIPDEISQLNRLGLLEISNPPRAMLQISPKLAEMKKLAVINFRTTENNNSQNIDTQLFNMPNLKSLLISAPELKAFPSNTQLLNLEKLCLLDMSIPENLAFILSQMPQLKTLGISHYQPFAPSLLAHLPHLSNLLLSRQMIPYTRELRQLLPNTYIDFSTYY